MCHCQPSHGSSIFCGPSRECFFLDANGNDIGSNEEKVLNLIREIPEIPENRIQCGPLSLSPSLFLRSPHSLLEEEDSLVLALSLSLFSLAPPPSEDTAVESAHHVQEILDANRPQSGKWKNSTV